MNQRGPLATALCTSAPPSPESPSRRPFAPTDSKTCTDATTKSPPTATMACAIPPQRVDIKREMRLDDRNDMRARSCDRGHACVSNDVLRQFAGLCLGPNLVPCRALVVGDVDPAADHCVALTVARPSSNRPPLAGQVEAVRPDVGRQVQLRPVGAVCGDDEIRLVARCLAADYHPAVADREQHTGPLDTWVEFTPLQQRPSGRAFRRGNTGNSVIGSSRGVHAVTTMPSNASSFFTAFVHG